MDEMLQLYMEETEELMQKAEDCIIRLETEYSSADVNDLFRIAHTIKGSSHMVGYEDVGNLMHRVEDMLDCARNGSIIFDTSIVSLCFEGLDTVKKMLKCKNESSTQKDMEYLADSAFRISQKVDDFIIKNKKQEEKINVKQPQMGIVSTLLNKRSLGKNKYYMTFYLEEDAPMISPVFLMILKNVEKMGTLVYSSISDVFFSQPSDKNTINKLDLIVQTDIDEADLDNCFPLIYVETIESVNLTLNKQKDEDICFTIRGESLFKTFTPEKDGFIDKLNLFIKAINLTLTSLVLLNTCNLTIIEENEIRELIDTKRRLNSQHVEMCIIADGLNTRRIMNIFDSIKPLEEFNVYDKESDAVLNMFGRDMLYNKLRKVAKEVYYE